ncbi:hypothetical protein [Streptomyces sp. NPDC047841]
MSPNGESIEGFPYRPARANPIARGSRASPRRVVTHLVRGAGSRQFLEV